MQRDCEGGGGGGEEEKLRAGTRERRSAVDAIGGKCGALLSIASSPSSSPPAKRERERSY